jgi:hypothetical protein
MVFLKPALIGRGEFCLKKREYRKNWARLIQKIYEIDPLCCPKCSGKMRILSFIEDEQVIEKILKHLGLWEVKARPPPKATASPPHFRIDYSARPPRPETGTGSGGATRLPIVGLDYALFQT